MAYVMPRRAGNIEGSRTARKGSGRRVRESGAEKDTQENDVTIRRVVGVIILEN